MTTPAGTAEVPALLAPPGHPAAREVVAFVVAAWGPSAVAVDGFGGEPVLVVAVVAAASVAQWALRRAHGGARVAVALAAGLALTVLQGQIVGTWTAVALVAVDWGVRGRPPWPMLDAPPRGAEPVVLVSVPLALAALRSDAATGVHGPAVVALVVSVCTATTLWAVLRVGRWPWVVVAVAGWTVLTSGPPFEYPVLAGEVWFREARYGPTIAVVAVVLAAVVSLGASRRGPHAVAARDLAPALVALPAASWWTVNFAVWSVGVLDGEGIGYRAWRSVVSVLPGRFLRVDALSAAPSLILCLLAVGAAAVVVGRRAWVLAAAAAAGSTALGVAVGAVWQLSPTGL